MSTPRDVPERYQNQWDAQPETVRRIIEELGTAESLIRDLAEAMMDAKKGLTGLEDPTPITCRLEEILRRAWARIPKHLRAPETTSTGESSTILLQEDLQ